MNQEKEQSNAKEFYRIQRILIKMILFSPIIYVFVLLILQTKLHASHQYITIFSTNFGIIAILFIILSVASILLSHLLLIPYINKIKVKDPERVFILYVNLFVYGAFIIVLFGLLIGIFGYIDYRFIDWVVVIPFIAGGTIHGIYLYCTEINPWFKSLEKDI